jgi:gentisate 1,2-dioxygenase
MKPPAVADSVEILNRDMAEKNLGGHWQLGLESYLAHPKTTVQPYLWKWADVHESLMRAGEVVSMEDAERRTVRLLNPALRERQATTHTIQFSFQYVKSGEHARPHRHTAAAFRFILKGSGAYTTVNGQKCVMEEGDLILTPQLTWHDHTNDSGKDIIWLDGLDIPLVQSLHQLLFEPYAGNAQPIEKTSETVSLLYGHARANAARPGEFFHYKWSDTYRSLRALVEAGSPDPFDGYLLEYRNPATGGPTMPTIQCAVQLLRPGEATEAHRHTSTVIYHAFRGRGSSIVGDQRFDWEEGDSFVVPLWHPHRHENRASQDAILFSMSDAPVLKSLELYREEQAGL